MEHEQLVDALHRIRQIATEALSGAAPPQAHTTGRKTAEPDTHTRYLPPSAFKLNVLAFIKKYGSGLSGDRKFTLLVAHSTGADAKRCAPLAELKSQWNKMTTVMDGRFNAAYANRAKANGWVDSPKHGEYALSPHWMEVFQAPRGEE